MSSAMYSHLILASGSAARRSMLLNVGLEFTVVSANIDERTLMKTLTEEKRSVAYITEQLAKAKALSVSSKNSGALVIGSDQTLEFEGQILLKSPTIADGKDTLCKLSGKTHRLYSSVSVAQDNNILFTHNDYADLTMHDFDEEFLNTYAIKDPDALTSCVGGYKIEGAGAWLFKHVKGDYFTIMGMPLLPLLEFFRAQCRILP